MFRLCIPDRVAIFVGIFSTILCAVSYSQFAIAKPKSTSSSRESSEHAEWTKGFQNRTYIDSEGVAHRYMMFVPYRRLPNERLPLLIYLNGFGANGSDGILPLKDGVAPIIWESRHRFPFVVIWPQCKKGDVWSSESQSTKLAMLIATEVENEFRTDPDRVFLSGISTGGRGAWTIAAAHPDRIAAAIPISAHVSDADVLRISESELPIWSYAVDLDGNQIAESNSTAHFGFLKHGQSPFYTELGIKEVFSKWVHNGWDFAYRNGGLYRWLANQTRSRRAVRSLPFELLEPSAFPSRVSSSQDQGLSFKSAEQKVDAPSDSVIRNPTTLSEVSIRGVKEVHLEFLPQAGTKRFGIGLLGRRTGDAPEAGDVIDLAIDDLSSSGAYSWPSSRCLQSASPFAERAICVGAWNDLRISFDSEHISVDLNGWNLVRHVPLSTPDANIGFVAVGDPGTSVQIRNVRIRRDPAAESTTNREATAAEPTSTAVNQFETVDMASIGTAWKKREAAFANIEVTWDEGDECRFASELFRPGLTDQPQNPSQTVSRLSLSPEALRYSTVWPYGLMNLWRKCRVECLSSSDEFKQALATKFEIPDEHPFGTLRWNVHCTIDQRTDVVLTDNDRGLGAVQFSGIDIWNDRPGDLDEVSWHAPALALHPLSARGIHCQLDQCQLISTSAQVAGCQTIVIEETTRSNASSFNRRFWLDPLREFVILRATTTVVGEFRSQVDIEYLQDKHQHWIPKSWKLIARPDDPAPAVQERFPGDELVFEIGSAKNVECIVDGLQQDSPLPSKIPVGAIVFDQATNEWARQTAADQQKPLTPYEVKVLVLGKQLHQRVSLFSQYSWRFYVGAAATLTLLFRLVFIARTLAKKKALSSSEGC
ncbi:alpha/beta hydrolase-fold protein [Schlesneria paludicola]|uniref:alpha/beta hydrolase-fold protein n=1 Tax=Schlesneria paludicola TaxID=360056 RepID=UPI000299FB31|nr:phospholipase/carboxylesterase [Schlesneria paludicola]